MDEWSTAEDEVVALARAGRDEEALAAVTSMQRTYPSSAIDGWHLEACLLVRLGRREAAHQRLELAVREGDIWRPRRLGEPDYDAVRDEPRFRDVLDAARTAARARRRQPRLLASPSPRPNAPLLLAFHGAASTAEPEAAAWAPASGLGYQVAALQSSQPAGPGIYCWDDPELVAEDVRWALRQLPPRGRVVLAGFSQGARVALRLALEASIVQPGGVVLVGPSLVEPLPPAGGRLRVAAVLGSEDPYAALSRPALDQLAERGHQVSLERVEGLGHAYPPDFAERLPRLLAAATRPGPTRSPQQP